MNFLEKLLENLSEVNFRNNRKITIFLNSDDKLVMAKYDNPSFFVGLSKKPYTHTTKIYSPKYKILYLFGTFFCKKKTGYKRDMKVIPLFKIYELYEIYKKKEKVTYDGHTVIFEAIHLKPEDKFKDEYDFYSS